MRNPCGSVSLDAQNYEDHISQVSLTAEREKQTEAELTDTEEANFRASLGKLMWIARLSRPDVAFEAAACAQAYGDNVSLEQNYTEGDITTEVVEKESPLQKVNSPECKYLEDGDTDMDHMRGFSEVLSKSHEVNKVNLYKVKKPKAEHTHLKIKNVRYLNKAIRKLHSRRGQKIIFTDIAHGDIEDIRINIHCDASLTNADKLRSQIGVCAMIASKREHVDLPQEMHRKPDLARAKVLVKNKPLVNASPIMWSSSKCQRIATSSYGAELQSIFRAFDVGCVLRQLYSELLWGHPVGRIVVDVRNDNLCLVNSINAITAITQEKRLAALLMCLRETLASGEINQVGYIPGTANMADALTKSLAGNDLMFLMTQNKCAMMSSVEKSQKWRKTASDKQYLMA